MQSGSTFKKRKKIKKRSTFTSIKSLNRYNLRHNNCVIFSVFLYFKYSFLWNSFIYKFVHTNLFVHRKKSYQLLICRVAKTLSVLEVLNHFIKSSSLAYKRVAYQKNLVYSQTYLNTSASSRTHKKNKKKKKKTGRNEKHAIK